MSAELPTCFAEGQSGLHLLEKPSGNDVQMLATGCQACVPQEGTSRAPTKQAGLDLCYLVTSQDEMTQQMPSDSMIASNFKKCLILLT